MVSHFVDNVFTALKRRQKYFRFLHFFTTIITKEGMCICSALEIAHV